MTTKTQPAQRYFQTFVEKADPSAVAGRLKLLRAEMARAGLDGFMVPRADAHRGEAVPDSEARLAWLTGFTGSAGSAIVGLKKAALFVDGRYTLQAPAQTDTKAIDVLEIPAATVADWVARRIKKGGRLGYDPWLMVPNEVRSLKEKLGDRITLVATENLVDRIWKDRPTPPLGEVELLGKNRSGKDAADKIGDLQSFLGTHSADGVLLSLPESICWLFNMRGRDVPNTPVVLGYALVTRSGLPRLYIEPGKLGGRIIERLGKVARLRKVTQLSGDVAQLGNGNKALIMDPATVPSALADIFKAAGGKIIEAADPVLLPKARKNRAELDGMREAHRLDGVALAKFLSWFDNEAPKGNLDEIAIVQTLERFRTVEPSVVDISFDTIAGAGGHGAIVHYRVTEGTNRKLGPGELMLVDSGAQYLSGTTDVTRTLFSGHATAEQKDRFTRVLKGMIGVSRARFPKGTTGAQIDILARRHLWEIGLGYSHGTGHGVGAFLGVHEGPIGIAPRYHVAFEPGMVVSNEPGFYKAGEYGIRIENLITVVESKGLSGFLEFETLTLAPIETRLIEKALLDADERAWLNAYHARVLKEIGPSLEGPALKWLQKVTKAI